MSEYSMHHAPMVRSKHDIVDYRGRHWDDIKMERNKILLLKIAAVALVLLAIIIIKINADLNAAERVRVAELTVYKQESIVELNEDLELINNQISYQRLTAERCSLDATCSANIQALKSRQTELEIKLKGALDGF